MKRIIALATGCATILAGAAMAQQPTNLPPLQVETKAKSAPKKQATKAPRPKAAPPQAAAPAPAPTLAPTPDATAAPETAFGPVDGLVATRSATGSKTDTPIIAIPRSVDVITADQMEIQAPQSIRGAVGYTPGVQDQTGAGSIRDVIGVRGFIAPVFLDGLQTPTDTGLGFARIRLEPYGLERLEVLKGPASALFGQVPPGGLINAVSKRPQFTPSNEVFLRYGTDNHREAGFDVGGPIGAPGELAYRLIGLARDTDLDFDFADRQRYFLAPSITWRPSADTSITFLGSIQRDSGFGPHQFVPLSLTQGPGPRISRKTYLGEPDFDNYHENQWHVGYILAHRFNEVFQFRQNVRYAESDQYIQALRAGALDINGDVTRLANGVKAGFQGIAIDNQVQADFVTGAARHRVLAGVDFQHIDSRARFHAVGPPFGPFVPPIDPFNPVYGQPILNPFAFAPNVLNNSTLQQTGIYLQDQIKLGGWIATLGLRHDWATTELEDERTNAVQRFQEVDDSKWTGFAGLSYLFDSGFAPYINYSTSFLPATGFSLINSTTGAPLKPTTGEGIEAGIKYQPAGTKTLITASVFQITQENVTTTGPAPGFEVSQTGEVRVRGFEVTAKTRVGENFDLIAGYSYLEPIITSTLPQADIGNDFQNVSRHTGSVWGMYTWDYGPLAGLGLGAGVRYVGAQYADAANLGKVPGFTLVDAAMTYDLKYLSPEMKGVKLQLNALNLFDKYYVSACTGGVNFCQLGESRTFLATLRFQW